MFCHFSHECKTLGKDFQFPNKTFYEVFTISCGADAKWSSNTVPEPCECKSDLLLSMMIFDPPFPGSKCVDPPKPDDKYNLTLTWNPKYPPAHNSTVKYKCDAGGEFNRFESDFEQNVYNLTCLPDNKFSTPDWPTCIPRMLLTLAFSFQHSFIVY